MAGDSAQAAPVAISFRGVSKSYRAYQQRHQTLKEVILRRRRGVYREMLALDDLSLDVHAGQSLGVIGANGSGKSTLLKLAAGIIRPNRGQVLVAGRVSALLELGAGFQPELSGLENVYLNAALLGLRQREVTARLPAIIEFSELGDFMDQPVKTYSSGMTMRLAFAVAVHVDPDVILLDEVLAVGDEAFQHKCFQHIGRLRESGKTVLLVTHALDAVRAVCDHAVWLKGGRIAASGRPREAIDLYLGEVEEHEREQAAKHALLEHAGRWGSGEASLTEVSLLGRDGSRLSVCHPGEPMRVHFLYASKRRVERPVVGIAFYRSDGTYAAGVNTELTGAELPPLEARGEVWLEIGALNLLPGQYEITVAIADVATGQVYDRWERQLPLQVVAPAGERRTAALALGEGIAYLPTRWHVPALEREGAVI